MEAQNQWPPRKVERYLNLIPSRYSNKYHDIYQPCSMGGISNSGPCKTRPEKRVQAWPILLFLGFIEEQKFFRAFELIGLCGSVGLFGAVGSFRPVLYLGSLFCSG